MRILLQFPFPGYLRIYGSTVRMLADRGHEVLLSYDRRDKGRDPSASEVEEHDRIQLVPPLPAGGRPFERQVGDLRAAADYLRYLDPRFADAPYLRRRLEHSLNGSLRRLARVRYGHPLASPAFRTALAAERLVPSDRGVERAIAAHSPDLVFVSPLLGRSDRNRRQTDTVKAARRLGIPVGAGIASWDHLTTKGVVKAVSDRLYVWNEIQRGEACELHRVPRARVVVTGAQLFDGWFDRTPTRPREELLASFGLDPSARVVLYVGSSPNIAPGDVEVAFVRRWLEALRADPSLAGLVVLVRPHPYSVGEWGEVDLGPGVEVVPRVAPALPMTAEDDALYYDSINAASAVVGINTSAMVETFIQRRAVLTIRAPEFHDTQEGTLHFRHLAGAGGGALQTAASLDEHVAQLREVLADPDGRRVKIDEFLRVFVRPRGLDRPATQILVEELEGLAARRPRRQGSRA
ncbi:MAG: hypothetical protein ACM3QU_03210 [Verrucomicrobiota bacterium]